MGIGDWLTEEEVTLRPVVAMGVLPVAWGTGRRGF